MKLDVLGFAARKFILQGDFLRIPSNMILLRYFLLHLKSMKYNTGTPLIGRFFGPRKTVLRENRPIGGVCMV